MKFSDPRCEARSNFLFFFRKIFPREAKKKKKERNVYFAFVTKLRNFFCLSRAFRYNVNCSPPSTYKLHFQRYSKDVPSAGYFLSSSPPPILAPLFISKAIWYIPGRKKIFDKFLTKNLGHCVVESALSPSSSILPDEFLQLLHSSEHDFSRRENNGRKEWGGEKKRTNFSGNDLFAKEFRSLLNDHALLPDVNTLWTFHWPKTSSPNERIKFPRYFY